MTPPSVAAMFVGDRMMASTSLAGTAAVPSMHRNPMHFCHRQTDTDIIAQARDVYMYITSRAKK